MLRRTRERKRRRINKCSSKLFGFLRFVEEGKRAEEEVGYVTKEAERVRAKAEENLEQMIACRIDYESRKVWQLHKPIRLNKMCLRPQSNS